MNAIAAAMTTQDEAVDREQSDELRKGPTRVQAELLAHWNRLVGPLPPDLAHRRPCLLGPSEAFPDEHAPASYFDDWTDHDPERMGPSSMAVTRRLTSSCAGWPSRPTAAEFYAAIHAQETDARQQALLATWAEEASYLDIVDAWAEQVYTIRGLVAALHKVEGLHTFTRFRWLNHMALVPEADGIALWNC